MMFADLAYPLPTFLPTFNTLIFKDFPTLPTFVRARAYACKKICGVIMSP